MLHLPVSPVPPPPMTRRVPLSNIPNAQPYSLNTAIPAKRPAKTTRETHLGPPPAKKAHLDTTSYAVADQKENRHGATTPSKLLLVPKTPSRQDANIRRDVPPQRISHRSRASAASVVAQASAPSRRAVLDNSQKSRKPSNVQKVSARDKQLTAVIAENNQAIREWQKHYLKVFPTLKFYLDDSVSEDKRAMLRLQLRDLDSTVVDHFSAHGVTHVVTSRDDIPPEMPKDSAGLGTVNPKHLSVGANGKTSSRTSGLTKLNIYEDEGDILVLARLNSLKIWTTEKIERMIHTLGEKVDDDYTVPHGTNTLPSKYKKVEATKSRPRPAESIRRDEELLGKLLKQDKTRVSQPVKNEMYVFKGPYVLVGDATGTYKHFIIREFRNVTQPENGDWPQFRSNREGRCPFVLDPDTKRAYLREEAEKEAEAKKEREAARAKARTVMEPPPRNQSLKAKTSFLKDDVRSATIDRKPLTTIENKPERDLATAAAATAVKKNERSDKIRDIQRTRQNNLVLSGYEPVASGLQPTGPTSAVVSQAISSNNVNGGPKAGTSRDVQRLNRRVFEKTTGGIRQTGALGVVDEENDVPAAEVKAEPRRGLKRARSEVVVKEVKKVPVAGYCENCRDKYDDFEKHIVSKRHVRFASNDENFVELDALLATLKRPRKPSMSPTPSY